MILKTNFILNRLYQSSCRYIFELMFSNKYQCFNQNEDVNHRFNSNLMINSNLDHKK